MIYEEITVLMWILLIFSAPVGMFVLWKNDKCTEAVRIVVSLINTLWLILAAVYGAAL